MPRVDTIRDPKLNLELPINFSSKSGLFTCSYASVLYEDSQLVALRTKVLDAINAGTQVDWIPLVHLTLNTPESRIYPTVRLECQRLYVAHIPNVGVKACHWECPEEGRVKACQDANWVVLRASVPDEKKLQLPYQASGYSGQHYLLAYSEDLWMQIEEIGQYFALVNTLLGKHLTTPEGITNIRNSCRRLFDRVAANADGEDNDLLRTIY